MKIAAVIVTHNRAAKLAQTLDAIAVQSIPLDRIIVVDNASTDDTGTLVAKRAAANPLIEHLRLDENLGGAGGFNAGMRRAYETGADYIWMSDDDAYPEPEAIERLVSAITEFEMAHGQRPTFACSRVNWTDGSLCEMNVPAAVWDWPRYLSTKPAVALVATCSFVSVLFPRSVVAEHGLPIKDYFIWFDDAEYTRRISSSYPGIFVNESRVTHDTPENKGVNFSLMTEANAEKFVYGARNEASYRWREQGIPGVAILTHRVRREMREGGVSSALRRRVYGAILRGIRFRPEIERV